MSEFGVFIPTRDSGRWIGSFLDAYRKIGVEPIYIVDSRSTDNTIETLDEKNANFKLFEPAGNFVESGMIEFGAGCLDTPWALRFDDDEFPSRRLIASCNFLCDVPGYDGWWLSRREICRRDEGFVFSTWPTRIEYIKGEDGSRTLANNKQLRLFRTEGATFVNKIHTAGLSLRGRVGAARPELFFSHFQSVLLLPSARLEKLRRYSAHDERAAWINADEYLPEFLGEKPYVNSNEGIEEFLPLLDVVSHQSNDSVDLTVAECQLLVRHLSQTLGEQLIGERQLGQNLEDEAVRQKSALTCITRYPAGLVPFFLQKQFAQLMLTLGRVFKSERLTQEGENLYRSHDLIRKLGISESRNRRLAPGA